MLLQKSCLSEHNLTKGVEGRNLCFDSELKRAVASSCMFQTAVPDLDFWICYIFVHPFSLHLYTPTILPLRPSILHLLHKMDPVSKLYEDAEKIISAADFIPLIPLPHLLNQQNTIRLKHEV